MTIQNPSTGPLHSNRARNGEANEAQETAHSGETKGNEPDSTEETSPSDQVEISEAARMAHSEVDGDAALIELGRKGLESASLSEGRLAELQQRVESGYYTTPEMTEQIAEGLAEDFSGPSGE